MECHKGYIHARLILFDPLCFYIISTVHSPCVARTIVVLELERLVSLADYWPAAAKPRVCWITIVSFEGSRSVVWRLETGPRRCIRKGEVGRSNWRYRGSHGLWSWMKETVFFREIETVLKAGQFDALTRRQLLSYFLKLQNQRLAYYTSSFNAVHKYINRHAILVNSVN